MGEANLQKCLFYVIALQFYHGFGLSANVPPLALNLSLTRHVLTRSRRTVPEVTCRNLNQAVQGADQCCSKDVLERDFRSRAPNINSACVGCIIRSYVEEPTNGEIANIFLVVNARTCTCQLVSGVTDTNSSQPDSFSYALRRKGDVDSTRCNVVQEAAIYMRTTLNLPTNMTVRIQFENRVCRRWRSVRCVRLYHMVGTGCTAISLVEAFRTYYYSRAFTSDRDIDVSVRLSCPAGECGVQGAPVLRATLMDQDGYCAYTKRAADPVPAQGRARRSADVPYRI